MLLSVASSHPPFNRLALQQKLFEHWQHWRDGRIDLQQLQQSCRAIRLTFEATLHKVGDLGCERGE